MKLPALVWALSMTILPGCCTPPKVAVTWYLQNEGGQAEPVMHLAFLNEGRTDIAVQRIVLNPREDAGLTGWSSSQPLVLRSGTLKILSEDDFVDTERKPFGPCQLPTYVFIWTDPSGPVTPFKADISGSMPNYLHKAWLKECR